METNEEKEVKPAPRIERKIPPKVTLTFIQNEFVEELVRDNRPNLWNWRKYLRGIAVGVGYSPQAVDKLRINPNIWIAANCLINDQPIKIKVLDELTRKGRRLDADRNREPGEPLNSYRQEKFCQEIIADPLMNARKASIRAGYSEVTDYGYKLMAVPKIKERIAELKKERIERLKADQDEVIANLVRLSRINMADYVNRFDGQSIQFEDSNVISRDEMYGIKKIKHSVRGVGRNQSESLSITLEDKFKANALLAKHLGLLDNEVSFDPTEFAVQLRQLSKTASGKVPGGEL
jgi:phage terminase small subunit